MLTIENLGKVFPGGTAALAGVSMQMAQGEIVSLLGPSGCGKSTLLRIAAGLIAPSSGRVEWTPPLEKGGIGVVFQDPTLMPWANSRRNVETPLRIAGVGARERHARAMEMLTLVGLENFSEAYPRTLSGGMKMRVSIARALVTRPPVLLLDEPFAALDEITRQQLNDDLLEICGKARLSVLFVTHSAAEAVYLSERILMMRARPGAIVNEIRINAPARRAEGFRHSPQFAAYCGQISTALRAAAA